MSPLQIAGVVVLLLAGAGWSFERAFHRAPRSMAEARRLMYGPAGGEEASRFEAWTVGPARVVERRLGDDLALVGLSPSTVVARVVTAAGLLGAVTLFAVAALEAMGLLPASPVWFAAPLVVAALAGGTMYRDAAARVARRRRELRNAANDLVQLVAVGLTTDQSVEEAIRFALDAGASEGFNLIRDDLMSAPQRGVPVWDALDELGRRTGVRELCEFASSVERQGLQGVSIAETVATLAASMRARALDELEREADRANANLSGPTIGFVVATIAFLAFPLAQRISEAFGG